MRIEVLIDELVLDGFEPRERHAIADAVERELARQLRQADLGTLIETGRRPPGPDGSGSPGLRGPDVRIDHGRPGRPDATGARIGLAVGRALAGAAVERDSGGRS